MGTSFQTHQDGPFPTIPRRNHHHQRRYQWYELIPVGNSGYLIWNHFHFHGILGLDVYVMWPDMFFLLFLIFMGLKWFTTSWNLKNSPRMLWEHHFRPIKMDHSQLYRGETITINKDTNYMSWYQWVIVGIWFGIISTFKVFLGWMCMLCDPICFSYFFSSSCVWNGSPHPETIDILHECYGNIISDPSRWTIPNCTEEPPSPSTKIPMRWVLKGPGV